MLKKSEQELKNSCWNKAKDNEFVFVLLDRDKAMIPALRSWIQARITLGINHPDDPQLNEVRALIGFIENKQKRDDQLATETKDLEQLKATRPHINNWEETVKQSRKDQAEQQVLLDILEHTSLKRVAQEEKTKMDTFINEIANAKFTDTQEYKDLIKQKELQKAAPKQVCNNVSGLMIIDEFANYPPDFKGNAIAIDKMTGIEIGSEIHEESKGLFDKIKEFLTRARVSR